LKTTSFAAITAILASSMLWEYTFRLPLPRRDLRSRRPAIFWSRTKAQLIDFPMIFSRSVRRGETAANRVFSGIVFWDIPASRKSSEHPADLSVFRQKYRSCMSALAYKIERFCLVP
jgi:hypothetical protein